MMLGFIGCGKMATALVQGVLKTGAFQADEIVVSDAFPEAAEALRSTTGVRVRERNAEVAAEADTLVICVKPGDAAEALAAVREANSSKLVISIMAGVPLPKLQQLGGPMARVVRVMPNTPALVHKGAAAYALGDGATEEDAQ